MIFFFFFSFFYFFVVICENRKASKKMLSAKTFLQIPGYFQPKKGSKRNYYRSIRILEPTIWWINYNEIDLKDDMQKINFYDIDDKRLFEYLTNVGAEIIDLERFIKKISLSRKFKNQKFRILDFKIWSETELTEMYYVSIGALGDKLTADTPLKVYCSCPDFRYTFAYVLYKHDALLYDEEFPEEFKTIPPKIRNPFQIPFVCKHVYTVLWHLYKNPSRYKFNEQTFYRYNKRKVKNIRPNLRLHIILQRIKEQLIKRYKKYTREIIKFFKSLIKEEKKRKRVRK